MWKTIPKDQIHVIFPQIFAFWPKYYPFFMENYVDIVEIIPFFLHFSTAQAQSFYC